MRESLQKMGIDASNAIVIRDECRAARERIEAASSSSPTRFRMRNRSSCAVDDQSRLSRADNAFSFITDLVYAGRPVHLDRRRHRHRTRSAGNSE